MGIPLQLVDKIDTPLPLGRAQKQIKGMTRANQGRRYAKGRYRRYTKNRR
ncbi:MAG: hypothetical protein JKX92_12280 [Porticoccaceae bacterium]|nr:hypothetical protein [Porticoccaceae bacterium]